MCIFAKLWDRWTLGLKIATPLLHILFSAAQLHGARKSFSEYREERQEYANEVQAKKSEEVSDLEEDVPNEEAITLAHISVQGK